MRELLRSLWVRLALYLPVILMGVLALGTYWLVRSTPPLRSAEQAPPVRHEPDYLMRNFSVKTFDSAGQLKNEVRGADARHYPDTDTLEVDRVRIRSFNNEGRLTTASAKQAVAPGDASEVQLFGDAQVVREPARDNAGKVQPRMEFRSDFLHVFRKTERVTSHRPVVLIRGKDQFTAEALDFDNIERVVKLTGRVNGVLVPDTAR